MGLDDFDNIMRSFDAYEGCEQPSSALQSILTSKDKPNVSAFHAIDVMALHWYFLSVPGSKEGRISTSKLVNVFLKLLRTNMMLPGHNNTLLWYVDDKDRVPTEKRKEQKLRDDRKSAAQDMYPAATSGTITYKFTANGIMDATTNQYTDVFELINNKTAFKADPQNGGQRHNIHLDGFKVSRHLRKPFFDYFIEQLKKDPLELLFNSVAIKNTEQVFIVYDITQVHRFHAVYGYSWVNPNSIVKEPLAGEADIGMYQWVTEYRDTKACVVHSSDSDLWAIGLCVLNRLRPMSFKYALLFHRKTKSKDVLYNLNLFHGIITQHPHYVIMGQRGKNETGKLIGKARPAPFRLFLASWILSGTDYFKKALIMYRVTYSVILEHASNCLDSNVTLENGFHYGPFFDRFASGIALRYTPNDPDRVTAKEDFLFNMNYWCRFWEDNDMAPTAGCPVFVDIWDKTMSFKLDVINEIIGGSGVVEEEEKEEKKCKPSHKRARIQEEDKDKDKDDFSTPETQPPPPPSPEDPVFPVLSHSTTSSNEDPFARERSLKLERVSEIDCQIDLLDDERQSLLDWLFDHLLPYPSSSCLDIDIDI